MRFRNYLGYAGGDVANNLTFSMASSFLLIYYTDVAEISAGAAGTLLLVVRVWGGATDLVAGRLVDGTSTRWGKFRPYLVFASAPLLLLLVAMFSIPSGLGDGATLLWAYGSYALFSLAYSFVNIPYGSLASAMTQDGDERAKMSTARMVAASVTILLIAAIVAPQISGASDLQRSLTITTIVFAVVGYLLYLWCFASTRENVRRGTAAASLGDTVAMLRHNRPLVILCVSSLLFLSGMFALQTVAVYYARDVLGDADLYIIMTIVQTVGMLVAAAIVPPAVGHLGKKTTYLIAGGVAAAAGVGLAVAPGSEPVTALALFGVYGLGLGVINTLIFALQADTVDYGEWSRGIRAEGASYAVLSFMRKVGQGVGGATAAYTIGVGGYVSGASDQPDGALTSIRMAAGALPAVAIVGATLVMLTYPLTEKIFRRLVGELAQRRAEHELLAGGGSPALASGAPGDVR